MKKKLFLVLALCTLGAVAVQAQTKTVFTGDDSNDIPYRIPAIVQTSNEDILVFSDKRHDGGDVGQNGTNASRIDVVYKRRNSQGEWDTNETPVKEGTSTFGYGDVAVVADRENPAEIVFFTAAGNTFFTKGQLKCFRFHSSNGGVTWDKDATTGEVGTNVTTAIYNTLGNEYTSAFFSSGRICQSSKIKVGSHYRLYAALCVTGTNSIVIYSDDFGESWYQLGSIAADGGDEAKCVELPNGNVLVSSKGKSKRYFNVFKYTNNILPTTPNTASGNWAGQVEGCTSSDAAGTNGELLLVQASKNGQNCYLVMQTIPASSTKASTRKNVTLYWKELDTADLNDASQFSGAWSNTYSLSTTTSSYSTMIQLADGSIAFAYEENYESYAPLLNLSGKVYDSYDIQFRNQSISDIASGYTLPVLDAPVISPAGGEVEAGSTVTISAATGATIYYTKDGSTPTTASNVYGSGAITVDKEMTIKAIAVKKAWTNSAVASAEFTIKSSTVTPVNPEVSLTAANSTLTVGETTQLTFTTNSGGAVAYTSSNPAVATVDGNGVVTAVAAGTATITATVAETDKYNTASASCEITVNAADGGGDDGSGEGGDDSGDDTGDAKTYELKLLNGKIGAATFHLVTFSAAEAVKVPNGVKAYYVKATDSENVKLTRVSGSVIPAKTGVILMSTGSDSIVTLTVTTEAGTALNGNLLKGTLDNDYPTFSATDYILAVKGSGDLKGQFAFCQMEDGYQMSGKSYANRAYLSLGATFATRSITLSFDGEEGGATAIDEVEAVVDTPAEYYTLQGVRVEGDKLTPGIYIMKHHGKTRKVKF